MTRGVGLVSLSRQSHSSGSVAGGGAEGQEDLSPVSTIVQSDVSIGLTRRLPVEAAAA